MRSKGLSRSPSAPSGSGHCGIEHTCSVGRTWQRLNVAIRRSLSEVSLAQLAGLDNRTPTMPIERELKHMSARQGAAMSSEPTMEPASTRCSAKRYRHGFVTDIDSDTLPPGLDEDVVRFISRKKTRTGVPDRTGASRRIATG